MKIIEKTDSVLVIKTNFLDAIAEWILLIGVYVIACISVYLTRLGFNYLFFSFGNFFLSSIQIVFLYLVIIAIPWIIAIPLMFKIETLKIDKNLGKITLSSVKIFGRKTKEYDLKDIKEFRFQMTTLGFFLGYYFPRRLCFVSTSGKKVYFFQTALIKNLMKTGIVISDFIDVSLVYYILGTVKDEKVKDIYNKLYPPNKKWYIYE